MVFKLVGQDVILWYVIGRWFSSPLQNTNNHLPDYRIS